jgi:ParB/RepB/Spo0J family partition protein
VPLSEIDTADTRFQLRLLASSEDLVASIRDHGQRVPVLLTGDAPPYKVVDGFRRLGALAELGRADVLAAFEVAASDRELFSISFEENARRQNLTAFDKAHAVWQALELWKLEKREVAAMLGLSVRQVDRYLSLLRFAEPIRDALAVKRISMAHAVVLHRARLGDASPWIQEIEAGNLSAPELAKRVWARRRNHAGNALKRDAAGFRLAPIRYRHDLALAEKRRIWDTLEAALRILAESERR